MTREHTVAVTLKPGNGAVTHCAGHQYHISIRPGEVIAKWGDGSPITRVEFELILGPTGHFQIANENQSAAQTDGEKEE